MCVHVVVIVVVQTLFVDVVQPWILLCVCSSLSGLCFIGMNLKTFAFN